MQLSPHFALSEFTTSQVASRLRLDNTPPPEAIAAMKLLCQHVLEPVRAHFGRPVALSSGYRSPKVNKAAGGAASSQHKFGQAADFEVPGIANPTLAAWVRDNCRFDQLILEFYTPGDPNSGWVHASYREPIRRSVLTAHRVRRLGILRTEYVQGIVA